MRTICAQFSLKLSKGYVVLPHLLFPSKVVFRNVIPLVLSDMTKQTYRNITFLATVYSHKSERRMPTRVSHCVLFFLRTDRLRLLYVLVQCPAL